MPTTSNVTKGVSQMFKGRGNESHNFSTIKQSTKNTNLHKLTLLHRAHKLLDNPKRQEIIKHFPAQMGLAPEKYDVLCQPVIENFVAFVQALPETRNSYFSHNGGMADHALERTAAALSACRAYFIHEEDDAGNMQLSEPQTLWIYALFTAAILYGIGKVFVDLMVELYDHSGKYLQRWHPFSGPMYQQGHYYDYDFEENNDEPFRQRVTLLLARQLMPEDGFKWIASDKDVLAVWLALLDDDQRAAGTLGPILIRADALAINNSLNDKRIQREFIAESDKVKNPLTKTPYITKNQSATTADVADTVAGAEFIKWLTRSLLAEKLLINQKPLFVVPGGLLLSPELFKLFVASHPEFKNWQRVQQSFLNLKVHQIGAAKNVTQNFIQISNKQEISGIVLNNVNLVLPEKFKVKSLATGEIRAMNPHGLANSTQLQTEFAKYFVISASSIAHLDASGKWQSQLPEIPSAGPNNTIGP